MRRRNQRLAARIGAGRAAEMVFTAAILPPETLASWGVINHVTPADSLLEQGRAFAQSLANGPTRAHITTKRVLQARRSGGVAAADRVTLAEGRAVMLSKDLQNGITSLGGRRPGPRHVQRALTESQPPSGETTPGQRGPILMAAAEPAEA